MFVKDFGEDPYVNQFVLGIFGVPGCGKTSAVADLAKVGQFVFLVSIDRGLARIRQRAAEYNVGKRLLPVYIMPTQEEAIEDHQKGLPPSFTRYLYRRLSQIRDKVYDLMGKGVHPSKIWICIDTVTHMQKAMLSESQEGVIDQAHVPVDHKARIVSELTTSPEWNANAAVMGRVGDYLMKIPVNIVYLYLQRQDKDHKDKVRYVPDVQGGSLTKYLGDMDVLLYNRIGSENRRTFYAQTCPTWEAKDRFGVLPPEIQFVRHEDGFEPTLLTVRNMIFKKPEVKPDAVASTTTPAAEAPATESKE